MILVTNAQWELQFGVIRRPERYASTSTMIHIASIPLYLLYTNAKLLWLGCGVNRTDSVVLFVAALCPRLLTPVACIFPLSISRASHNFIYCIHRFMASASSGSTVEEPPGLVASNFLKTWAHGLAKLLPKRRKGQAKVSWTSVLKKQWSNFRQLVPEPAMERKPSHTTYNSCRPDTMVYFWDPPIFFPECESPRCIVCGSSDVESNGWPSPTDKGGFLPIVKVGGVDWVYAKSYKHKDCQGKADGTKSTTFNTVHPAYLDQLPEFVRVLLPGYKSPLKAPLICTPIESHYCINKSATSVLTLLC